MRAAGRGLLVLLLAALAPVSAAAAPPLPPNPHQPMNAPDGCTDCHTYYGETLEPYEFFVSIPETCWVCHTQKALGRSHPIGVDPSRASPDIVVPPEIPLENGKVSCGSCHNPHLDHLSTTPAFPDQEAAFVQEDGRVEIPWYKTYYLRISDPVKGAEPLCTACHKDY